MNIEHIIGQALHQGILRRDDAARLLFISQNQTLSLQELALINQLLEALRSGEVDITNSPTPRTRLVFRRPRAKRA
ncbi:MAG: hypothetical protein OHK0012_22580 [Synechococcales cyanobacterium]